MLAFARFYLRLTSAEFYRSAPRYLNHVRKLWTEQETKTARMIAVLRVDMINHSLCRPETPVCVEDLLGPSTSADTAGRRKASRKITAKAQQEIANAFRRLLAAHE